MSQLRLVDVSQGKPVANYRNGNRVGLSTDLLWPYHLPRIAVDSWLLDESTDVPRTDEAAWSFEIRTSLDGQKWTVQEVTWVLGSKKSTLGTGPTFVAILKSIPVARYVSVKYDDQHLDVRLRCFSNEELLLSDEKQKYSMGSVLSGQPNDVGVLLVGGSNTVMRYGWAKALAETPTRVEAAAALGASSNIFAVRTLKDHPNPIADVLLYNANVIEYPLMRYGEYDFELARDATKYVLAYCEEKQLFPINVIWPEQDYIDAADIGDFKFAADTYFSNLSYELSMPFIDGYRVLRVVQQRLGRKRASLFRDQAHLNHFTAQLIGRGISKLVSQLKSENAFAKRTTAEQLSRAFEVFDLVDHCVAANDKETRIKQVSNSLISQQFVELGPNRSLTLEIGEDWEVVGYLINARHCNASIMLEGKTTVVKRAAFKGFNPDPEAAPFVCTRALPFPIRPSNGKIKVSMVAPSSVDIPDMLLAGAGVSDPDEQTIEIGQLILRSLVHNEKRASVSGFSLDLTSRVIENLDLVE